MRKIALAFLDLSLVLQICLSQNLPVYSQFNRLTIAEGLSNASNYYFYTDSRRFSWIGTIDGVNRFDGRQVKRYLSNPEDSLSLSKGNPQSPFFEAKNGDLWFTTHSTLHHYSRKNDCFYNIDLYNYSGKKIDHDYRAVYLENDSLLWIGAGNELHYYEIHTGTDHISAKISLGIENCVGVNSEGNLLKIYACPWLKRNGFDIITINPDKSAHFASYYNLKSQYGKPLNNIRKSLYENDTSIWIISEGEVHLFNPLKPENILTLASPVKNIKVKSMAAIDTHYMAVTTKDQGVWFINRKKRQFEKQIFNRPESNYLLSNNPNQVFIDQYQSIWISHEGLGIDYTTEERNKVRFLLASENNQNDRSVNSIVSMDDEILISAGSVVYSVHSQGTNFYPKHIKKLIFPSKEVEKLRIAQMDEQHAWVYSDHHIYQVDKELKKKHNILEYTVGSIFSIINITERLLWLGTSGALMGLEKSGEAYNLSDIDPDSVSKKPILHMFADTDDNIYIHANSQEIWVCFPDERTLKVKEVIKFQSLIQSVALDATRNCIWLATQNGLMKLSKETFEIINVPLNNINPNITGVLLDNLNNLWLASSTGIIHYKPQTQAILTYFREKMIAGYEFKAHAALKDKRGFFWWGTGNGILRFHPDSIQPYPDAPYPFIEKLYIHDTIWSGKPVADELGSISIPYYGNKLSMKLIPVTPYLAEFARIQYRMLPIDTLWKELGKEEVINFQILPPGSYTLEFKALNANGIESTTRNFSIRIKPPYWQTIWFWGLVVLSTVGISWGISFSIIQRRLEQERQKQKIRLLEERQKWVLLEERNRIAAELHDDLGAEITGLRSVIAKGEKMSDSPQLKAQFQSLQFISTAILDKMSDIIWAMDPDNDTLDKLLYKIRFFAVDYLDNANIQCEFLLPDTLPDIATSGPWRRNVLLTCKECFQNIVKHSQANLVKVNLDIENLLKIQIYNNGQGFDPELKKGKGNGLGNIYKRMNDIQGNFSIQSQADTQGATYTIEAPYANQT